MSHLDALGIYLSRSCLSWIVICNGKLTPLFKDGGMCSLIHIGMGGGPGVTRCIDWRGCVYTVQADEGTRMSKYIITGGPIWEQLKTKWGSKPACFFACFNEGQ